MAEGSPAAASTAFQPLALSHEPFRLEHPCRGDRPPSQLHLADDVALGHEAPVAAVGAVVPMVAHHKVEAFLHHLWTPVVVTPVLHRYVVLLERDIVHI